MVYEHEIPKGARLYFAKEARLKRHIESTASEVLYQNGFEEIVTPHFSYHQHHFIEPKSELIRLSDEKNRELSIRADSTVDVVRLVTKRLGRSTEHKKWFYIQPVFRYPSSEYYQIGAEVLEGKQSLENLKIVTQIFRQLGIAPRLMLANIKIPSLVSEFLGIDLELFKRLDIDALLEGAPAWLERLLFVQHAGEIDALMGELPEPIEAELVKLKEMALALEYEEILLAPLFYAKMRYYKDLFFRFFSGNATLATGGDYEAEGLEASGFALYTDEIISLLQKGD